MDERTPLITTVYVTRRRPRYPHTTLKRFCSIALASGLIAIVICFLLPLAILPRGHDSVSSYFPWSSPYPRSWPQSAGVTFDELIELLLETPNEDKARSWSEYYTSGPHLAGKNLSQALWTRERWEEFGVKSDIVAYDVFINYPSDHRLALLVGHKVKYECSLEEDIIDEDPTTSLKDRIPTFHGYSASGNVTAPYVYVNFGTYQDFEDLRAANITLEGKIALAKYGRIFRGLKVKRAQELGMVGVVIYSDPQEDGDITEENGYKTYPDGPARNPSSVQRGSTQYISTLPGDPTTPGYPSKPGAPRVDPHGSTPRIPSLPISYADALPLLKALNGHGPNASSFNKNWQGGGLAHKGVEYNIGPSPDSMVLNLMNEQEYVTTPLWNVIGIVNGTAKDEVIVVGNHRDAWIAGGAGDPNSGSAALNEVIRSFGEALKAGWKPLRTIVFASWDGEEYGLIGSTEWVEEYLPWLSSSTVAYLNVDVGARGTHFEAAASPLLNKVLYAVTASVPSPNQTTKGQSVADVWDGHVRTMGSGSDFTAFQDFAGIPSLDFGFASGPKDAVYHYHSNYDSFHWMDNHGDNGWHYHVTVAKILALVTAQLSETPVLSLSAQDYANGLSAYLDDVKERSKTHFAGSSFSFEALDNATAEFSKAATRFDNYTADLTKKLAEDVPWWDWWRKVRLFYEVRNANEKYKTLERQFLFPGGLDHRPWFKHVVFAPGRWTGYAGATYPGLVESFEDKNITNARRWSVIIEERLEAATKLLE
ncbi:glutamate carboxypeptidase II [Cladophialophora psammophila CBS 110553]|uniref:Glutamate carboxypeptidase II n=1 Tax=Cladophialophora psammophila CBS 110553 TaxID=1182543 RepID=W9WEY4_9EURO|nr:glutamate carboxypeptidase II [Cladophialophora psammophila CBS 110553]EXJ66483.1 glutamate carboxypeptidase II [Cladophialophora psammophila CBS 110553]